MGSLRGQNAPHACPQEMVIILARRHSCPCNDTLPRGKSERGFQICKHLRARQDTALELCGASGAPAIRRMYPSAGTNAHPRCRPVSTQNMIMLSETRCAHGIAGGATVTARSIRNSPADSAWGVEASRLLSELLPLPGLRATSVQMNRVWPGITVAPPDPCSLRRGTQQQGPA